LDKTNITNNLKFLVWCNVDGIEPILWNWTKAPKVFERLFLTKGFVNSKEPFSKPH
jgi:hypothetical protein